MLQMSKLWCFLGGHYWISDLKGDYIEKGDVGNGWYVACSSKRGVWCKDCGEVAYYKSIPIEVSCSQHLVAGEPPEAACVTDV